MKIDPLFFTAARFGEFIPHFTTGITLPVRDLYGRAAEFTVRS